MSEPPPSDEDLIAAYKASGDPRSLEELVRPYVGKVRIMIVQMVLNDADADDLTQEVFLRAVKGVAEFRGQSRFSTWLYRIAMNTVRSFLSREGRRRVQYVSPADRADARTPTPDELAMAGELDGDLSVAVGSLSPALRAAVVLTTLQGLGVNEAARIEDCTVATMYWRIHKARKILKRQLAKYLT